MTTQTIFGQEELKEDAEANFKNEEYAKALDMYLKLYKSDSLSMLYNYRIGKCYLNLTFDKSKAIPYLDYVAKKEKEFMPDAYFDLAIARLHAHYFNLAILTFNLYKGYVKKQELKDRAERYIEMCMNADALVQSPVNVTFENLGNKLNSVAADFNPFVNANETFLSYTSDRNSHNDDVFCATRKKGTPWNKAKAAEGVNTSYNEYVAGMTKDGRTIYLHSDEYSPVQDINETKLEGKYFSEPFTISENINTRTFAEEGICISAGGDSLFFASNRPDGLGGFDIYLSLKLPTNEWGTPMNLGAAINTPFDDNYPSIAYDSRTLYFSSKGYNSMGGYDIFYSRCDSLGNWAEPQNMGYPVNTTYDDKSISFLPNQRYAYMASMREEGLGDYDIYKVTFNDVEPDYRVVEGVIFVGDSISGKPINNFETDITITVKNSITTQTHGIYSYNHANGKYAITLFPGKYELLIEGDSYQQYKQKIEILDVVGIASKKQTLNLYLKKKTQ